jgi:hypothetical protein
MKLRKTLVLCAVLALSVGVATAIGGNSTNAKLCQKNGWKTAVYRADGSAFASQDACVSYAANGGTFAFATIGNLTVNVIARSADGTGAAQDFPFTLQFAQFGADGALHFSLDDDNSDATLPASQSFELSGGSYTVAPVQPLPSGWTSGGTECLTDANSTVTIAPVTQPQSATINLGGVAGDVTCTFTFSQLS